MRRLPRIAGLGLPTALAAACVSSAPDLPKVSEIKLEASDFRGLPQALQELPRRPRLRLSNQAGFALAEQAYVLFPGESTTDWNDDLSRAPLRAEHTAQLVNMALTPDASAGALLLEPRATLDPDCDYVLAVAAWAKSRYGAMLSRDGSPHFFALHTAADPDAGARPVSTWPIDGTSSVAPELPAAVIAFDGRVEGAEAGIWLEGPDGLAVEASVDSAPCAQLAPEQSGVHCVRLRPQSDLAPDAIHRLVVGVGALDAHGAPVGPFSAQFRTATQHDHAAPTLRAPPCAVDEQPLQTACALIDDTSIQLRCISDEPTIARLSHDQKQLGTIAPAGEFSLQATGLPSDRVVQLELSVRDSAGNQATIRTALRTTPPLATLSISEILADPLGPEPRQEWVELFNYGDHAVELHGLALSDRGDALGPEIAQNQVLAPQTRALLVADDYDPLQGEDLAPPPGVTLVRMGRALAGSGLSNAGEPLFLRDPQARRLSAAAATPRPRAGICNIRVATDPRTGDEHAFAHAPTCSPGN